MHSEDRFELQILSTIGDLVDSGREPSYPVNTVIKESLRKRLGAYYNISEDVSAETKSILKALAKEGYIIITPKGIYPTTKEYGVSNLALEQREKGFSRGRAKPKMVEVGSPSHLLLNWMSTEPKREVLKSTRYRSRRDSGSRTALYRLMESGLIDKDKFGNYSITTQGKEALQQLDSGEHYKVKPTESGNEWHEYFRKYTLWDSI